MKQLLKIDMNYIKAKATKIILEEIQKDLLRQKTSKESTAIIKELIDYELVNDLITERIVNIDSLVDNDLFLEERELNRYLEEFYKIANMKLYDFNKHVSSFIYMNFDSIDYEFMKLFTFRFVEEFEGIQDDYTLEEFYDFLFDCECA